MSSYSTSLSFTETHAKKIASKVATDLKRIQRFYGEPSDSDIKDYETELIELLKKGYLGTVTYGYKKDDKWIVPTLEYTARELADLYSNDDDPGRVESGANVSGAVFHSYLSYSSKWSELSFEQKDAFKKTLPYYRSGGEKPGMNGYMIQDKSYSAGGGAVDRSTLKKY